MRKFSDTFISLLLIGLLYFVGTPIIYALDWPANTVMPALTRESSIEEIRKELNKINIPVLDFSMENGEFPTCEYIEHPEGCNGNSIINNEYVSGKFTISLAGNIIYDSGDYVAKESGVRLKLRGNTSSYDGVTKKSYKIKLSKKADLLFRDDKNLKDKDWVLLGLASQKLHYPACTEIGRICGIPWEPSGRHVVVIMNDKYIGTYYLSEAVSGGSHRVNIDKSGYIVENDAYWWKPGEVYFKTNHQQYDLGWTFKEPDTDDFHEMSIDNIKWALNNVAQVLYEGKDVSDLIDYESFANWLLAHDILMTRDGYGSNMFVVKRNFDPFSPFSTKFEMGPLWDFDSSLALMSNMNHAAIYDLPGFWYNILLKDPLFAECYSDRWKDVRENLKDKLMPKLEQYVMDNLDVFKTRYIDYLFGLISPSEITHPVDDHNYVDAWIDDRVPILNSLILGEESIIHKISPNDESFDPLPIPLYRFTPAGIPTDGENKQIIISVDKNGKSFKYLQ